MSEISFPDLHKLKVVIEGEDDKVFKSKDLQYLFSKQSEYMELYKSDKVESFFVSSNVDKVKKPRYKTFSNFKEDWENFVYGRNSEDTYYLMNTDTLKVIKLKEVK